MTTLNKILLWVNSSRKLFITVVALVAIQFITIAITGLAIAKLIEIDLTEIITGSFSADGIIVGAYCATNVGEHLVDGVKEWIKKKRK